MQQLKTILTEQTDNLIAISVGAIIVFGIGIIIVKIIEDNCG